MTTRFFPSRLSTSARRVAIAALLVLAPIAFASDASSRYVIEAELRPLALSADGRFGLDATARYAPEAKSDDGRFVLKAVNVPAGGCEASPDAIFANGFEGP